MRLLLLLLRQGLLEAKEIRSCFQDSPKRSRKKAPKAFSAGSASAASPPLPPLPSPLSPWEGLPSMLREPDHSSAVARTQLDKTRKAAALKLGRLNLPANQAPWWQKQQVARNLPGWRCPAVQIIVMEGVLIA